MRAGTVATVLSIAILGGAAVGLSRGSGASLGTTTSVTLGAASSVVTACQSAPVTIALQPPTYSGGRYVVPGLTVSGWESTCVGRTVQLTIFGGSAPGAGDVLYATTKTVSSYAGSPSDTTVTGLAIDAALVQGVAILVK